MNLPVDILRMESSAARIVHCRLPAWRPTEHESVSTTSAIGFSFTTQRAATVESDGKRREKDVTAGHLELVGVSPISWLRVHEPSELIEITASPGIRRSVASELGVSEWADLAEIEMPGDPTAWAIAARFRSALRGGAPVTDLAQDTMVRLLYASVYRRAFGGKYRTRGNGALDQRRLTRVCEYIETYLGSSLSLEQLSHITALSPFHFLRSFREATGVSPHRYVTMRRMEHAKDLLLAGEDTARVMLKAGYSSRSWFAAAFRQHFGFGLTDVPIRGASRWN